MPLITELEASLYYTFTDKSLLEEALMHPSMVADIRNSKQSSYERLEFLGDAVLGLIIADLLVRCYPDEAEGDLAKRRAALVCHETLAQIAGFIHLGSHIKMADGEESSGGRENPANLEDSLEAVVGAIYRDGGIEAAKQCVERFWAPLAEKMKKPPKDPKSALQEWSQAQGKGIPEYTVIMVEGPPHAPIFTIEVKVDSYTPCSARGSSKRVAEREAAKRLLENTIK